MTNAILAPPGQSPLSTSPRLDDPTLDVLRRSFIQYLKDGNDPRTLPTVMASTIEEHDSLYYVVLRVDTDHPPLKVYRLFNDLSLKGLYRLPAALKAETENAEVAMAARRKGSK
jgi:hypothetical protein